MKSAARACLFYLLTLCTALQASPDPTEETGSAEALTTTKNTYTAENTLKKYQSDYPFITIASTEPPSSVTEHKNLVYVSDGERNLELDLYLPNDDKNTLRAAVVLVHGGGWQAGYRTHLTPIAIELAKAGIAAATISYRLAPEALYPAAIQDTKAAIRWLRSHAQEFQINPQQIAVAGSSAGVKSPASQASQPG